MVQQMRLARFSKRSAREAEYREYLRKEEERVEEMAAAEAARVATVLDRRAEAVEARVAVELQRVETGEVLDSLTRLVAYQEAREALEFLLESAAGALRVTVVSERRVLDHIAALEKAEELVYKRERERVEAYRAEDGKFRAEQVEARDEASSLHARELNKSMVEWRKDLEKITDDARFEATETRKRFTKKQGRARQAEEGARTAPRRAQGVAAEHSGRRGGQGGKDAGADSGGARPGLEEPRHPGPQGREEAPREACNQPIPLLKDLKVEVAGVINVADTKKQQKSWLDTLHAQRTDKMKEDGGESKILLLNARKKFEAKFEREIDLETKAVIKKQDEVLAIKKQEDAAATEEYTKKLDEEAKNMEELFKKQGADFTELMSGKKTKIREFWEKNKSKQRKANQSRTDATASKVESLKRQLQEKIREIRPKEEDEARATRLYEARAKCMTARTQSYCENVMALFNGRSQETDVFCKEHFDVVYHCLNRPTESARRRAGVARGGDGGSRDRDPGVGRPLLGLHEQAVRPHRRDQEPHAEARPALARGAAAVDESHGPDRGGPPDASDQARGRGLRGEEEFHGDIQNLEMEVVEALVAAEQEAPRHQAEQDRLGQRGQPHPRGARGARARARRHRRRRPRPRQMRHHRRLLRVRWDGAAGSRRRCAWAAAAAAAAAAARTRRRRRREEDGPWDGRLSIGRR